jgi:DNA-binding IscR family transcriptional regulator
VPDLLDVIVLLGSRRKIAPEVKPDGAHACEWSRITADEILRATGTVDDIESKPIDQSKLLDQVVMPALSEAEQAFAAALSRINIEELARSAQGDEKVG